ncbi:MAG TPA: hypothetical protein VNZ67_03270 [bacterium]|jgi:exopolyphosphatase/guanosine-5'-triphosphate,3'-diphosphate pyrophosphatase|nr:hypothetical protein [bacterium]
MNLPAGLLKELHGAPPVPGERVLSLIDLGTNSVRLDLVAVKGRSARRLHREKRMVRLGDDLYATGHLSHAALARVTEALDLFQRLHEAAGVTQISAVATAAMRAAPDAADLVAQWKERYHIGFRVISGEEEAALIAKGVMAEEHMPSGGYGLVDIGGGSTEISLCQDRRVLESFSLPLGANRLAQEFLKSVPAVKGGVESLRAHVQEALAPLRGQHRWPALRELIGSGGSVRAIRRLAKAAGVKDQPFTSRYLSELCLGIEKLDRVSLLHLPGMDDKRVDLILPGALILDEVCQALGAQKVRSTEATLRDGLLAEALQNPAPRG